MDRRRVFRDGLALGAAALAFPGRAQAGAETLTLYSGQHRYTSEPLVAAFSQASGIKVSMRQAESPELSSQIQEEGGNSPADVFYSEQSPPVVALAQSGILAPIEAATLAQVPARYRATDGTWIGTSLRARVVAYNKDRVASADLPRSIFDFQSPAMKDRFAYVVNDGFQEQVMAIEKTRGRASALAWLKSLKANGQQYKGNTVAMKAVEAGEIDFALVNSYYWYAVAKEVGADKMKAAIHFIGGGDPGALLTLSAAGILKTTKNMAAAQRFVGFLVSPEGQRVLVDSVAEYPARAGIVSPYRLAPIDDLGAADIHAADFGNAADAYALEREAGII